MNASKDRQICLRNARRSLNAQAEQEVRSIKISMQKKTKANY